MSRTATVTVKIGAAHSRILVALERIHARTEGLGCGYHQLADEVGISYTHCRRLVTDLLAVGEIRVTEGVNRSLRPAKKAEAVVAEEGWS